MHPDTPTTPEPDSAEPQIKSISVGEYANSVGELVAKVARQHKLPPGVAFNVVAWSVQHLEQQDERAQYARQAAAAAAAAPEATLDEQEEAQ